MRKGDDAEAGGERVVHIGGAGGRGGDGGGDEHRAVDAVRGVRERRVAMRLGGGGRGVAGVRPAVHIGADGGTDPLPERIAVGGGAGRLDAFEEVAVGDALGGEGTAGGEFVEPEPAELGGGERLSVALEEQQIQQGVVEVVVLGHAVDVLGERGGGGAPVPGVGGGEVGGQTLGGEPGAQRPVAGGTGESADGVEGELFDGFAEKTADAPAEPGGVEGVEAGFPGRGPASGRPFVRGRGGPRTRWAGALCAAGPRARRGRTP